MGIEGIEFLKDDDPDTDVSPDTPLPTDNTERPEDGPQDVSQDPSVDYSSESE